MMLLLDREEIKRCFSMKDAIASTETAFVENLKGMVESPLRTVIPAQAGNFLFMSAYARERGYAILKTVNIFPGNFDKGLPTAPSALLLFEGATGLPLACLDGTYVTQLRTGGATGAALRHLAREDVRIAAMIGSGGQAETQIEAMLTVRKIQEVRIADVARERAEALACRMRERFPMVCFRSCSEGDVAVTDADVIVTATSSKKPTFSANHVKPGATISAVGAYRPDMQEIDPQLVAAADKVFCDDRKAVLAESGDIIIPLQEGLIEEKKLVDLAQVLTGEAEGRTGGEQVILFETVGFAAEDLMAAATIYEVAKERGYGTVWA